MTVRTAAGIRTLAAVSALTAAAGGTAEAASQASRVIRPGMGVGKLNLGMTEAEVRRAMGQPWAVIRRPAGFGLRSVEYQYDLAAYTVRFVGARGRLRAVRITTIVRKERTPKGIGPGSLERDLVRAYPGIRCGRLRLARDGDGTVFVATNGRECTLTTIGGRRTIFRTSVSLPTRETLTVAKYLRRARIDEVVVARGS
jgi:hypothetical protein